MKELGSTRGKQYFYIDLSYPLENIEYYFIAKDGKTSIKFKNEDENFKYTFEKFEENKFEEFNSLVWYQIEVDRFRNSNPYNSKPSHNWNSSWTSFSEEENEFIKNNKWYTMPFSRKYGGDLQGIIEKLNYLDDLGVNVLLLSPIFSSEEKDARLVKDHLSFSKAITSEDENKVLEELLEKAHEKGMKIIVELPLTASKDHVLGEENLIEKNNTFFLSSDREEVKDHLVKSAKNLKEIGVDGIMINSLKHKEIVDEIKKKTNIFITIFPFDYSENFAAMESFDSIINLRSFSDLLNALTSPSLYNSDALRTSLELNRLRYPTSYVGSIISPISTIDTERALSAFINSEESNTKAQENEHYKLVKPHLLKSEAAKYLELAVVLFSTYPGSFMFAYGDEVGMFGAADPDSKKPMIWEDLQPYEKDFDNLDKYEKTFNDVDKANNRVYFEKNVDNSLKDFFSYFLNLRRENLELFQKGTQEFPRLARDVEEDLLVYYRKFEGKAAIVIINISKDSKKFTLPLPYSSNYVDPIKKEAYDSVSRIEEFEVGGLSARVLFTN